MIEDLVKTPDTVAELIEVAQRALELNDEHVADALGYDHPVVVDLLKQGKMRLPITKVPLLANVLQMPAATLLQMLLRETAPEMLDAIKACYGPMVLSESEARLIRSVRETAGEREPALIMFDKEAVLTLVVAAPAA